MHTITTKLSDDLNTRLENLAKLRDRTKSYLVRKAVESFLEEKEDYFIALTRLEHNNPKHSLEGLEKEYALEN